MRCTRRVLQVRAPAADARAVLAGIGGEGQWLPADRLGRPRGGRAAGLRIDVEEMGPQRCLLTATACPGAYTPLGRIAWPLLVPWRLRVLRGLLRDIGSRAIARRDAREAQRAGPGTSRVL